MKRLIPAAVLLCAAALGADSPIRVLILSGRNNHDWRTSTPMLRKMMEQTGRFEVRVTEEPSGLNAAILRNYDVIVSDYCGPRWGEAAENALETAIREGKGFVAVHAASYPFGIREVLGERMTRTGKHEPPWTAYAKIVGASWTEEPRTGHGKRHVYEVRFADREHPIARGLPESFFTSDELYHQFKLEPNVHTLATAFDAPEVNGTGRNEPILMTNRYGKGRVFHTALGHDATALASTGFIQTFVRGVEWAATGQAAIPAAVMSKLHEEDAVRVLVVTGGHDYDPTFGGVFEGNPRIRATMDPHPAALNRDLVKRFDAIVFYDMVQDIDEKQRKNLVDFAEAGKGIIVMHHALANYQKWDWWKDLAGARYSLADSKYLHDRHYVAKPVGKHAILNGIPELYMLDETYRLMMFAPTNTVLLTTKDETADGPLVWISAYPKSRVVGFQPGHNRESHTNESFRRLVHNAILWSAGRLE
jgi:hypothetical protein